MRKRNIYLGFGPAGKNVPRLTLYRRPKGPANRPAKVKGSARGAGNARADLVSALVNLGYTLPAAKKSAAAARGDTFDSQLRDALRGLKNPMKQYVIVRKFIGGTLKGLTHKEVTTAKFRKGQVVRDPIGGSPYRIISVTPVSKNPRVFPGVPARAASGLRKLIRGKMLRIEVKRPLYASMTESGRTVYFGPDGKPIAKSAIPESELRKLENPMRKTVKRKKKKTIRRRRVAARRPTVRRRKKRNNPRVIAFRKRSKKKTAVRRRRRPVSRPRARRVVKTPFKMTMAQTRKYARQLARSTGKRVVILKPGQRPPR